MNDLDDLLTRAFANRPAADVHPSMPDVHRRVRRHRRRRQAGLVGAAALVGVSVGIAVWGAIFVAQGADKVSELTAGTPTSTGERPRQLVEAASSGNLDQALAGVPAGSRPGVTDAAREGFLAGFNDVLTIAALVAFAAARHSRCGWSASATSTESRSSCQRRPAPRCRDQRRLRLRRARPRAGLPRRADGGTGSPGAWSQPSSSSAST